MRLSRIVVATLLVALTGAACTEPPPSTPPSVIDQQLDLPATSQFSVGCSLSRAQTFTAGRSGTLDKVSLVFVQPNRPEDLADVQVEIQPVVANLNRPSDYVIGSGAAILDTYSAAGQFIDVPLSAPASIEQGVRYALVVKNRIACPAATGTFELLASSATDVDGYGGGELWTNWGGWGIVPNAHTDLLFRTWVR